MHTIIYKCNRSRCHGNVRLNDDSMSHRSLARDSKSRRRTYVAGRVHVTINPIHVRGRQSARDDIIDVIKPVLQMANVAQRTRFVANL